MDFNNIIIDRVLGGYMFSRSTNELLWKLTQITNPSLNCSAETVDVVDAIGAPIMTLDRAKTAELSGENAQFDLALAGAQMGSEKILADGTHKIVMPTFEEFVLGDTTKEIQLKHEPVGAVPFIYALGKNSSISKKYKNGTLASETDFTHTEKQKKITLPTGLTAGTVIQVYYEYESETGAMIENRADKYPVAGKFVMDILGCDVCDQAQKKRIRVVMDNAKLTSDVDMAFTTEGTHPFTIKAMQNYCDVNKRLFSIMVVDQ